MPTVRAEYWAWRRLGWTEQEAAAITAYDNGLPLVEGGWTLDELNRLLFARFLYATGRWPDDVRPRAGPVLLRDVPQ